MFLVFCSHCLSSAQLQFKGTGSGVQNLCLSFLCPLQFNGDTLSVAEPDAIERAHILHVRSCLHITVFEKFSPLPTAWFLKKLTFDTQPWVFNIEGLLNILFNRIFNELYLDIWVVSLWIDVILSSFTERKDLCRYFPLRKAEQNLSKPVFCVAGQFLLACHRLDEMSFTLLAHACRKEHSCKDSGPATLG